MNVDHFSSLGLVKVRILLHGIFSAARRGRGLRQVLLSFALFDDLASCAFDGPLVLLFDLAEEIKDTCLDALELGSGCVCLKLDSISLTSQVALLSLPAYLHGGASYGYASTSLLVAMTAELLRRVVLAAHRAVSPFPPQYCV